ncbi:hypothetical protein bcere0021_34010 [Bacillus cereus Rock3-42]|nr:hypothetical protein bcere0021_34010 [Bacillus cereus Rock3-42]
MHNLEISNNRSIVKSAFYCIKTAFEKIFFNQYVYRHTNNMLII